MNQEKRVKSDEAFKAWHKDLLNGARNSTVKKHVLEVMSNLIDIAEQFHEKWIGHQMWIEYRNHDLPEFCRFSIYIHTNPTIDLFVGVCYSHVADGTAFSGSIYQPAKDGYEALIARLDNLMTGHQPQT